MVQISFPQNTVQGSNPNLPPSTTGLYLSFYGRMVLAGPFCRAGCRHAFAPLAQGARSAPAYLPPSTTGLFLSFYGRMVLAGPFCGAGRRDANPQGF